MTNLESIDVKTTDVSFDPITHIVFIMKNGAQIGVGTPLSVSDFMRIWNTRKRKVKIVTGRDAFACVNKRRVDFFHIFPAPTNN